jgi:glycosyltransferase involved in cell wall biosynthesis
MGSEPGVGWHWALEISRLGHEVWVLTRADNQPSIEAKLACPQALPNLHFVYCDQPAWSRRWNKPRGYLDYLLWQWRAYQLAKALQGRIQFDLVHHITYASVRLPVFMGNLGIPFIFGPAGGGESARWRLRVGYSFRGWILDGIRDLSNSLVRFDPLLQRTYRQAEKIYVTSEQTLALLPKRIRGKSFVQLAIGIDKSRTSASHGSSKQPNENRPGFRVIFVGRFLHWKGMNLGLAAFANIVFEIPKARLTMVGSGPDESRWRRLADKLGISKNIDWVRWVPQTELASIYASHDVLLFPSFHDSGGMVVLEAMMHGLPVICLDLGGPGMMVNNRCGFVISTAGQSKAQVSTALTEALSRCAKDPALLRKLGAKAIGRAQEFTWAHQVDNLYANLGRS